LRCGGIGDHSRLCHSNNTLRLRLLLNFLRTKDGISNGRVEVLHAKDMCDELESFATPELCQRARTHFVLEHAVCSG